MSKGQFWKENSIACNVDDLIYIQAAPGGVPDKEKIRIRLTDCCTKNTKVYYDETIHLDEAKNLLAMLQSAVDHADEMNRLEQSKKQDVFREVDKCQEKGR